MSLDPTSDGSPNSDDDMPHHWRVSVAASAGLMTWVLTHDINLAIAVAGLVLAALTPST